MENTMAVQMVALRPYRYSGKALKPGDVFSVRGKSDARVLIALGRAAVRLPPPAPPKEETPRKEATKPEGIDFVTPSIPRETLEAARISAAPKPKPK